MANEKLQGLIEEFDKRRNRRAKMMRIGGIAAICAAVVVSCALVVPAVTATYSDFEHLNSGEAEASELICTQEEHIHDDSCLTKEVTCELPEGSVHVHVPSCYNSSGKLVCGNDVAGHIHTEDCYKNGKLVCKQTEVAHMHTEACYKNGKLVCDSDLPHVHGITCYEKVETPVKSSDKSSSDSDGSADAKEEMEVTYKLVCTEKSHGHIHTAACQGEDGDEKCDKTEQVSVTHIHSEEAGCYTEEITCGLEEHEHTDACYKKIESDDVSSDNGETSDAGNASDASDAANGMAEPDLTDDQIAEAKDQGLLYENKSMIVVFDVPDQYGDAVKLEVSEVDEPSAEAATASGSDEQSENGDDASNGDGASKDGDDSGDSGEVVAASSASEDDPVYQVNLQVRATLNDVPVDNIADLGISATLQMKSRIISPILKDIDLEDAADEAKDDLGAEIKITQYVESVDSSYIEEIVDDVVVTDTADAATTFNLTADTLTATVTSTPNPSFTVFYKANVEVPELVDNGELEVIDTSNGGNNTGGNLPKNNKTLSTKSLKIGSDGKVQTTDDIVDIYSSEVYKYHASPTLNHFNKVYNNGNYQLSSIVIDHKDGNVDTINSTDLDNAHFTNRAESAGTNNENGYDYYLITDNCEITLIFDLDRRDVESIDTSFYDYDISDGQIYTTRNNDGTLSGNMPTSSQGSSTVYANTYMQGINSSENYSGSGAYLGFGNSNTGTGLQDQTWNNNTLNKANKSNGSHKACTFELVTGLNDNGVQFAPGVSAPNLFGGDAVGKTTYSDGSLRFNRNGDTYTLSSATVDGNTVSGLNTLGHPGNYTSIWTNDFWPLDNTSSHGTDGHDLKFGSSANSSTRRFSSPIANSAMPQSDDGQDHNAYFGMHYTVNFSLTDDYIGPLNYLFFGDDDLWVFLDGKLVLDIGGIHSSVGEYVDLWDYLEKGKGGDHTLSIYYTERGASGSTCYMNFTLPSVSTSTIAQDTGELKVSKVVAASDGSSDSESDLLNKEFEFRINLSSDEEGQNRLPDDYSYTRYSSTGDVIESDLIVWDGGTFRLRNGEYVIIKYLPEGAHYEIQEVLDKDEDPYLASYDYYANTSTPLESDASTILGVPPSSFKGVISDIKTSYEVKYTNAIPFRLPDTGGIGFDTYLFAGLSLILLSIGALFLIRSRRQETFQA